MKNQPDNLDIVLGLMGSYKENSLQMSDLNIFSSALAVEQLKSQTSPGEKECGLEGDFLSWEKSLKEKQWTLHSKARWIDLDGGFEWSLQGKSEDECFLFERTELSQ